MSRRQAPYRGEPEGRQNEYFLPSEGISREVIQADICRYLGNDALIRRGRYEDREGYLIRAYRNLTTQMIADLKADSERWEAERSRRAIRGQAQVSYEQTGIHNERLRIGPSQPPGSYLGDQAQYMLQRDYPTQGYDQPQDLQYGQPVSDNREDYYSTLNAHPGQQSQQGRPYGYASRDGFDPRDPRHLRNTSAGYESASLPPGYATQQEYAGAVPGYNIPQPQRQGQHSYGEFVPPLQGYQPETYGGQSDSEYGSTTQPSTDDTIGQTRATAGPPPMFNDRSGRRRPH